MKIYTKKGDKGETSLIGGKRVPKYHDRIEAYGTVDELNSYLGLIRDQEIDKLTKGVLFNIQNKLFVIQSSLALDPSVEDKFNLPQINQKDIEFLENEIDKANETLAELKSFIIPGGHTFVSYCHIARCVCRRAERLVIKLSESNDISPLILKYLNRLSDYLFVLSRKIGKDSNSKEIVWKPRV
jgi:cob(I)alamin adenosyltransferase